MGSPYGLSATLLLDYNGTRCQYRHIMKREGFTPLNVLLPDALYAKLKRHCHKHDQTLAEVIRALAADLVKRKPKEKAENG